MMTNDMGDTEKLGQFIAEARDMGIEVLPPDVNESELLFAPARTAPSGGAGAIRFGLAAIKGVGEAAVAAILEARRAGAPFRTLAELCERVETRAVNRKVLEALIKSGACDAFGETRATLWHSLDRVLARASHAAQDRARGQTSLFGMLSEPAEARLDAHPRQPEWPAAERLAAEKELLGFYVTGHPLAPYRPLLERYALATTAQLASLDRASITRIGGLVAAVQQGISKKTKQPYAIATIEDLEGTVQVLCVNENFEKFRALLQPRAVLLVTGEVNLAEDKPKLFPLDVLPLEEAPQRFTKQVHVRLPAGELAARLEALRELVTRHRGRIPLFLCVLQPGGERVFIEAHEDFAVLPSLPLQQEVEALLGAGAYHAQVDPALPARPQRRWERRPASDGNGSGEE